MGLFMSDNGYYYIKCDFDGKRLKFSTRTRDPELAGAVYTEFLKKMVEYRVEGQLNRKSNLVTVDASVQSAAEGPELQSPPAVQSIISFVPDYNEYIDSCVLQRMADTTINVKRLTLKKLKECGINFYSDFIQKNINAFIQSVLDYSDDSKRKFISGDKSLPQLCH